MRAQVAQYLNEIISLSILALMSLALIAGQAGAAPQEGPELTEVPALVIEVDLSIRHKGE